MSSGWIADPFSCVFLFPDSAPVPIIGTRDSAFTRPKFIAYDLPNLVVIHKPEDKMVHSKTERGTLVSTERKKGK
jgi:hypothetical protein